MHENNITMWATSNRATCITFHHEININNTAMRVIIVTQICILQVYSIYDISSVFAYPLLTKTYVYLFQIFSFILYFYEFLIRVLFFF